MPRRRRKNRARQHRERESLTGLGKLVVPGYSERLHWYHRQIAEALEGLLRFVVFRGQRGGYARVALSMPGRHGKSLHGVELFPALGLGLYPDLKFMITTNTAKLARKSVRNTRTYMEKEEYLKRYATRLGTVQKSNTKDAKGKVQVEKQSLMFRTLKRSGNGQDYTEGEGYYMAQGIGGSIVGEGFDIGIMDDWIKNPEQALSDNFRERAWDFYMAAFDQRADHPWAGQLYVGHRWTKPDFVDDLISHWRSESTEGHELPIKVIQLPALAEEPLADYDPREIGEGLDREDVRPKAWYIGKRNALLSTRPWVWHGMYQQNPTFSGSKFFQADEWRWYNSSFQLRERLLLVDFSIDSGLSETGQSFTVINVYGYLHAGRKAKNEAGEHYFWLDERRGHWKIETLYEEFEYLWRKWSTALPDQFDVSQIANSGVELQSYEGPRVWVENKALGHNFTARYQAGASIENVISSLSREQLQAVAEAIEPVPKMASKLYCYKTAGQVTSMGRVWLPQEAFGIDPITPHLPLVDPEPLGVQLKDVGGEIKPHRVEEGKWVHELGNFPSTPDDRRDVLAQQIICRTPWMRVSMLASR